MILVTGASGLNGGEIMRRLAQRGVAVRALVRSPAKWQPVTGAELAVGDMGDAASLRDALSGAERAMVISSSAPDMKDVQNRFIDAAKSAGVKHIVKLSGIMPEVDSPFRFARMHGEVEKHLEASGVAWTHLRAGEFMHAYFRQVPSIVNKGVLALSMADARIACIDVGDVADVAVRALTEGGHEGKIHSITGPEALSMNEVAAKLGSVAGKTIRYVDVSPADAIEAREAAGFPRYLNDALDELFAERRRGKESKVWPTVQTLLGRPATSFDAFAQKHAAIFRGEVPPPRV